MSNINRIASELLATDLNMLDVIETAESLGIHINEGEEDAVYGRVKAAYDHGIRAAKAALSIYREGGV